MRLASTFTQRFDVGVLPACHEKYVLHALFDGCPAFLDRLNDDFLETGDFAKTDEEVDSPFHAI